MPKKPLLLMDFDGVIMDSASAIIDNFRTLGPQFGVTAITDRVSLAAILNTNFYESCDRMGVNRQSLEALFEAMKARIFSGDVSAIPFDWTRAMLQNVSQRFRIYIVSSNERAIIDYYLSKFSLSSFITNSMTGDDFEKKTDAIAAILKNENQSASHTYFVGDTAADVMEGKAAGVITIAVSWGYHTRDTLLAQRPHYIADDLIELETILEKDPRYAPAFAMDPVVAS